MFGQKKIDKKIIKHQYLVLIDRDRCTILAYPDELLYIYAFPSNMILDGDVINREEFRNAMTKWLTEQDIKPTEVIYVVMPSITFQKTFSLDSKKTIDQKEISSFIDSVPFQKIVTAQISEPTQTSILVTNKELLNSMTHCFELAGFINVAIFPYKAIGDAKINKTGNALKDLVDLGQLYLALAARKNYQALEFGVTTTQALSQRNFAQISVTQAASQEVSPMVAVIVVLFFIMVGGGVMYWRFDEVGRMQRESQARIQNTRTLPASERSAVTPDKEVSKVNIEILASSTMEKSANQLQKKLGEVFGSEPKVTIQTTLDAKENSIVFSEKIPEQQKALVLSTAQELGMPVVQKSGTTTDFDIVISLPKTVTESLAPSPASSEAKLTSTPTP